MRTGEGKTLVATLPVYLNALEGKGVHVVTVNDYLATPRRRVDGQALQLPRPVASASSSTSRSDDEKRARTARDITYGQNNEFGFDYLRDNMKFSALDYAQRPLNYAIVDEVDSILIDEARTPLIISGQAEAASEKYRTINEIIPRCARTSTTSSTRRRFSVTLTDDGVELAQKLLGIRNLYDPVNLESLHILNQCSRAHALYKRDVNYMVSPDGKVLIIDEFTGRVLAGRRWTDGLHQAVEAKENVRIQEESRTMATITFQNLFRIYKKLAGMTGTADTEAAGVPLHVQARRRRRSRPTSNIRARRPKTSSTRPSARSSPPSSSEILEQHEAGRPVLVGTTSVEKSARDRRILEKKKHHAHRPERQAPRERGVRRRAGGPQGRHHRLHQHGRPRHRHHPRRQPGDAREARVQGAEPHARGRARGVRRARRASYESECKIEHDEVVELGGLHILGTERHESRRIDNQLRGRAGRQGDPGSSSSTCRSKTT